MKMMGHVSVLFVSPTVPYPATDGGKIRVLNLITRLCRIHEVTLLTFITSPADEQAVGHLQEMGMEVVGVKRGNLRTGNDQQSGRREKFDAHRSLSRAFLGLRDLLLSSVQRKPLTVVKYYSAEMARVLVDLLKSRRFDIIHFEMLHTGQFLLNLGAETREQWRCGNTETQRQGRTPRWFPRYATVLGQQNIDSSIWYRLAREEPNMLRKLLFYWQYRSFVRYESRMCCYFDTCICVSKQDQRKLASLCPGTSTEVVPNGVDLDYFQQGDGTEEDQRRLVFTGSMDWRPNEDAVVYFCDRILPLIWAELPDTTFFIVGSNPTDRVLKLRKADKVIVTGWVEDVRSYIAEAAVYVVPLRIGSGTRLKILEALAMKKAVLSTSIGCEGLDVQQDRHLLVADDPEQFAAATIGLMRDKASRRSLGENGRGLVERKYGWDIIAGGLDTTYRRLISERLAVEKAEKA